MGETVVPIRLSENEYVLQTSKVIKRKLEEGIERRKHLKSLIL